MEYECDVVVVGGGPAGSHTAMAVAKFSNQNLRVILVDRNPPGEFGKKTRRGWSCGDAVSKRSLDTVCNSLNISYSYPEIEHEVDGVLVYSPDHEVKVLFDGEGYMLNRKLWPQKQREYLERFGVEVLYQIDARTLLSENGRIVGVAGLRLSDQTPVRVRARVVVDASGSASVLRAHIPIDTLIEREIDKENDMEATGRYILDFERAGDDETWFDPRYCIIHLDQYLAPGGYCWVFPKGESKMNVGLGVQRKALERRNRAYGKEDTLVSLIDEYVRRNKAIRNARLAAGSQDSGNEYSTWQVPVRRQNDCMVANGFVIIGDAAWMPRPIDAGGMGPALYASVILGKVLVEAVESNDTSEDGLWKYNVDYVHAYGYQMASFEVLRRYLQTLPNEKIDFGMRYFLSQDDIESIKRREHPRFPRLSNLIRLLTDGELRSRIRQEPQLARNLKFTADKSRKLIKLYMEYPEMKGGFQDWVKRLRRELNEAYQRFS
ncbi:MAG: NAD(P)/FAD-dependent oxidoreductase [Aigarchaeota archaeon]|nr:NAD(P)/FAD-dependent oxidoreductase [Aigarchaeota archaeon]MDW8092300.1 NAD(P)/FAD-dependent oxidoreductase [Nitrososphaerota archaeon]